VLLDVNFTEKHTTQGRIVASVSTCRFDSGQSALILANGSSQLSGTGDTFYFDVLILSCLVKVPVLF